MADPLTVTAQPPQATPTGRPPRQDAPSAPAARPEQPTDTYVPSQPPADDLSRMQQLRRLSVSTPREGFRYDPVATPDLRSAQSWQAGAAGLSGTDANAQINDTYHRLDQQFTKYMGEPRVANWMTFGKYASREAGEQIRNLEDVEKAVSGDPVAAANAARNMADPDAVKQGVLMGGKAAADNAGSQSPVLVAVSPAAAGVKSAYDTGKEMGTTVGKMRDALVEGNTEIYQNIAPAYDAFLKGESAGGKGGMQALKDAGYYKGSEKDPQGFVAGAFEKYTLARQKGLEADRAADPAARQRLLDERKDLMNQGNLQIGLQEQMVILQRPSIFGDATMAKSLERIGGTMSLTDANGKHELRPDGKNWAGFADRMGLKTTTADDPNGMAVRDHDGKTTHYVPDPSQKGTIYEYFTSNVDGPRAKNLMDSAPRPLVQGPSTMAGQGLVQTAEGVRDLEVGKVGGGVLRTVGGTATGAWQVVGEGTTAYGQDLSRDGSTRLQVGLSSGSPTEVIAGGAEMVAGEGASTAGTALQYAAAGGRYVTGAVAGQVEDKVGTMQRGAEYLYSLRPDWMK